MKFVDIEKSLTDTKSYRFIELDNRLRAVIISDLKHSDMSTEFNEESIQKAAAALCINIGSFSDPMVLQGLAHYLEHMVFMGSKKYPTENDFDACVSQHGGYSNAWTDAERTLFYFDCHKEHFEEILDKFANFFISPLLLKSSMSREVTAVSSEFEMAYPDDFCRMEHLLQLTAKDDNPYVIFTWGNKKSLVTDPAKKNIDVHKQLETFRNNYYSAQNMTLAVQARDSLDNIEAYVRKIFSEIPCNDVPLPNFTIHSEPFDTPYFNKIYFAIPVTDTKNITLTWTLPPIRQHYKAKPCDVMGYLLGDEGVGSLTDYLRKRNLIVELEAGNSNGGFDSSSFNSLFIVRLTLTDLGFNCIDEIVEAVFSYINLMKKGIPELIYKEIEQISKNDFMYRDPLDPIDTVEKLAVNLQLYEEEHLYTGGHLLYEMNSELVQDLTSRLTVDKVNIAIMSRTFETIVTHKTDWFDMGYTVKDLTPEQRQMWSNPRVIPDFHLPLPNKFIATDFTLVPLENNSCDIVPINIAETTFLDLAPYGDLWHMLDPKFRVPKGFITCYLQNMSVENTVINATIMDILMYGVNQQLCRVAYDSRVAGYYYKLDKRRLDTIIIAEGFSDKLCLLFSLLIDEISKCDFSEAQFEVYKEAVRQNYIKRSIKAETLSNMIADRILFDNVWIDTEKLEVINEISVGQLQQFHSTLYKNATINSYFHGNILPETAKNCIVHAINSLNITASGKTIKKKLRSLPFGTSTIGVYSLNHTDTNTSINIQYLLGHSSMRTNAFNNLLADILCEPCFDFLRTKESLGYKVGLRCTLQRDILGMNVFVVGQVDKFSVKYCIDKMYHFFEKEAVKFLENLSEDDFHEYKQSCLFNFMKEDTQMSDSENRNWNEIINMTYIFDRRQMLANEIENITQDDLIAFFKENYLAQNVRKLNVYVDSEEKAVKQLKNAGSNKEIMKLTYLKSNNNFNSIEEIINQCTYY